MDIATFNSLKIKCNDVIKIEVFIYKQRVQLDGIFLGLIQSDISIKIGLSEKHTLIPLGAIIKISPLLYDANNKLDIDYNNSYTDNSNNYIQGQILIPIKPLTFENETEPSYTVKFTYNSLEDIKSILQFLITLAESFELSKLLNFNFYATASKYIKLVSSGSKNKKSISNELVNELRNNIDINRSIINDIHSLLLLYVEIYIELSEIYHNNQQFIESSYIKLKKFYTLLIQVAISRINSENPIQYTNDIKFNYLKTIQYSIYLKHCFSELLKIPPFLRINFNSKTNEYTILNQLNNNIYVIDYILSFYSIVYNSLKEMSSYEISLFIRTTYKQLYKKFKESIPTNKLNYSESSNKTKNFCIPLFIKKDASIQNIVISLIISGYEADGSSVKIELNDNAYAEKVLNYAHSEVDSGNLFSLNENLQYIYILNKPPFFESLRLLFIMCRNALSGDFSNIYTYSSQLLKIYKDNELILNTTGRRDNLIAFLSRLNIILNENTPFIKAEKQLLLTNDYCANLIEIDPFDLSSTIINKTCTPLNVVTHSVKFIELIYRRYYPEIKIDLNTEYISYNNTKKLVYLPLTIILNNQQQPPLFKNLTIELLNTGRKFYQEIKSLNNDSTNHLLLKIPLDFFILDDDITKNIFRINLSLLYSYKKSFNIELNEPMFGDAQKDENYTITIPRDKRFYPINNTFSYYKNGSEVQDRSMFFGRDDYISKIINSLLDKNGDLINSRCILLYGQTRTGKSSLVYHIKNELMSNNSNIILVDIDDIGTITDFEIGFEITLLSNLIDSIELEHDDLAEYLENNNFLLNLNFDEFEKKPHWYFNAFMHKLSLLITKSQLNKRILLVIDEFTYIYDWINQERLDWNFLKFFKGIIQNFNISSLMIGQDHTPKFINDSRFTGFFNSILLCEVNYLSKEESYNLISSPVSKYNNENSFCNFSDECLNYLYSLTLGSPYITMNLCSDFVDYLNTIETNFVTINHAYDFINDYIQKINEIIFEPLYCEKLELDSESSILRNKRILSEIALKSDASHFAEIDDLELDNLDKQHILDLRDRNVVEILNNRCRIKISLYSLWLRAIKRNYYVK